MALAEYRPVRARERSRCRDWPAAGRLAEADGEIGAGRLGGETREAPLFSMRPTAGWPCGRDSPEPSTVPSPRPRNRGRTTFPERPGAPLAPRCTRQRTQRTTRCGRHTTPESRDCCCGCRDGCCCGRHSARSHGCCSTSRRAPRAGPSQEAPPACAGKWSISRLPTRDKPDGRKNFARSAAARRVREAANQKNRDQCAGGQRFKGWGRHTTPESRDCGRGRREGGSRGRHNARAHG